MPEPALAAARQPCTLRQRCALSSSWFLSHSGHNGQNSSFCPNQLQELTYQRTKMQCCLDAAVLVVLSILFLNPASLVTAFRHHLMPSNGLAELVIRALKRYYLLWLLWNTNHYVERARCCLRVHCCRAAARADSNITIQRTEAS